MCVVDVDVDVDVDDNANENGELGVSNYFLKCAMTYETETQKPEPEQGMMREDEPLHACSTSRRCPNETI